MKNYRDICKEAEKGVAPTGKAVAYVWGEDVPVLVEELANGWSRRFREFREAIVFTPQSPAEMIEALDDVTTPKLIVARGASAWLHSRSHDRLMLRIDRQRSVRRSLTLLTGDRAVPDQDAEWWSEKAFYGRIREPAPEMIGKWVAVRSIGRLDYTKKASLEAALVPVELGLPLMEWVGWDFAAALQAIAALRVYFTEPVSIGQIKALVPPMVGAGYVEALVFGGNRRKAMEMGAEVPVTDSRRVLGLIRYHLRMFGTVRAVGATTMSERDLLARTGLDVWRWRTKYKSRYARYTDEKIRLRLIEVSLAAQALRRGQDVGVLEVLAARW